MFGDCDLKENTFRKTASKGEQHNSAHFYPPRECGRTRELYFLGVAHVAAATGLAIGNRDLRNLN